MRLSFKRRDDALFVAALLSATCLAGSPTFAQQGSDTTVLPDITVTATAPASPSAPSTELPIFAGQTATTVGSTAVTDTRAFSVLDVLNESPGVEMKQGNGPRDIGVSIRGSNANNGFGVRGAVLYDDGFPVTQPDGLSRTDLVDPHAYGAIDIVRGPSSAQDGDYAIGGSVNFRMRPGGEINGVELGTDFGSFGYLNTYILGGVKSKTFETSLFASNVDGTGYTDHSRYKTQTFNSLTTWNVTPDDAVTLKAAINHTNGALSNRLSLNQYLTNPYQKGCVFAGSAAAGCQIGSFYINGFNGAKQSLSADEAGLDRDDIRAILGLRWEHSFSQQTTWRTQFVYDDRNINQPTGSTSAVGDYPSINIMSDITNKSTLFGLPATHFLGVYFNTLRDTGYTYNVIGTPGVLPPLGQISIGGLTQKAYASQQNLGVRGREEISLNNEWGFEAALAVERSNLNGWSQAWSYTAPNVPTATSPTYVGAQKSFLNAAPQASITYKPSNEWLFRSRVSTAYLTPQVSYLFVLPTGVSGNNTGLLPEKDLGVDVGTDWTPNKNVKVSVTGFYEFLTNELRSQATPVGAPNSTYYYNVPQSQHRGVEASADWSFLPGWKASLAYAYDNQIFTNYSEVLTGAGATSTFNRTGNLLPGVPPQTLYAKLGYEQESGPLKGLGAYVEYYRQSSFFMDNANLLSAPSYQLVNGNVHWTYDPHDMFIKEVSIYSEVRNIFNTTYVASANNIGDQLIAPGTQAPATTLANTTGTIYAGIPRTFLAGLRVKF